MPSPTDLGFLQEKLPTSDWRPSHEYFQPMEMLRKSTTPTESNNPTEATQLPSKIFEPPIAKVRSHIVADTAPLQIWEGTVLNIDIESGTMNTLLNAKMGVVPRHTADIDLQWVSEQDKELLKPGAVFYLTLYKRTKLGGSIENSQELRFRRRPTWSSSELKHIKASASELLKKMTALPIAE